MDQHRRDGSTYSERNSKADPFEISHSEFHELDYLLYSQNHRNWSFAFAYASTSSKCILFSIRCLIQLYPLSKYPWAVERTVSEMIDWLKVRDPTLIREIFCSPDRGIWEEPNSGPSTTGSLNRLGGRCTQEN